MKNIIDFYYKSMTNDDVEDHYKLLSVDGYQCRQSFFILINEAQGKLKRINWDTGLYTRKVDPDAKESTISKKATQKFTSYNNVTGASYSSYSFNTAADGAPKTSETST